LKQTIYFDSKALGSPKKYSIASVSGSEFSEFIVSPDTVL